MLEQLANLGEFVGGFAVVVTFVYLSLQIKQNSKVIKAQIRQSIADNQSEGTWLWATDPLIRGVVLKQSKGEPLTEEEQIAYMLATYANLRIWENYFSQKRLGNMSDEDWESQKNVVRKLMKNSDGMEQFWVDSRNEFNPSFALEMDALFREAT